MSNLSKAEEIINETQNVIKDAKKALISLNEACVSYISLYEDYNQRHRYDSSLLKERIKNTILRTVSDDI